MKPVRKILRVLLAAAAIIGVLIVFACNEMGPPLLRRVTAAGGWVGACPPQNDIEARGQAQLGLALSPELNSRLVQQFPPGSAEDGIVKTLTAQGFKLSASCANDPSIRIATFKGYAGGIFDIWAAIYWKVDNADAIVWTKGFVAFDGL
jgi:hypothetical protein